MKKVMVVLLSFFFLFSTGFSAGAADTKASQGKKDSAAKSVENMAVDVLVIGAGAAGLAAGAAAKAKLRDAGRVVILEKYSYIGGNSTMNIRSPIRVPGTSSGMPGLMGSGGQAAGSDPQAQADAQFQKLMDYSHYRTDLPLIRRLVLSAQTSTDWLWSLLSDEEKKKLKDAQSSGGQQVGPQSGERYSDAMSRLCKNLGVENDTYAGVVPAHSSGWALAGGRIAGENAAVYAKSKKK